MNHDLIELSLNAIGLVLVAAWRALPILAIALLIDFLFRRRLAPKYHVLLWSLVVVRLLLPLSLPSTWSAQGPLDRLAEVVLGVPTGAEDLQRSHYPAGAAQVHVGGVMSWPAPAATPQSLPTGVDWGRLLLTMLVGLWGVVAFGAIVRMVIAHARFAWRLRSCRELDDSPLIDVVLRESDALRVARRPKLREVAELSSPAVFGLFRHTICLPVGAVKSLSAEELRWVLRHELAHVRRRDMWLLSLASIMRSLHWFNPLAWLTVAKLRCHVEAAADELALGRSSATDAVAYGRLLLKFAEQATTPHASPALGFLQFISARNLRGRIERLTEPRVLRGKWMQGLVCVALLALAVVGLTDAGEPAPTESFPAEWVSQLPASELTVNLGDSKTGPIALGDGEKSVRSYDVAKVLEALREPGWEGKQAEYLLAHIPGTLPVGAMRVEESTLIANLTENEHQELGDLLDAWRQGGVRQITLEVRVLQADVGLASSLDWRSEKVDSLEQRSSLPVVATTVADAEMRRFMRALQSDADSNILMAPKVTVFNGQAATIEMLTQRPFVTSVRLLKDGIYEPVVEIVDEGLKIGLRPVCMEGKTMELGLDLRASKIGNVSLANLPFTNPKSPDGPVRVQVPQLSTTAVRVRTRLAHGETLLIAAPQPFDQQREDAPQASLFYAITPRLLDE